MIVCDCFRNCYYSYINVRENRRDKMNGQSRDTCKIGHNLQIEDKHNKKHKSENLLFWYNWKEVISICSRLLCSSWKWLVFGYLLKIRPTTFQTKSNHVLLLIHIFLDIYLSNDQLWLRLFMLQDITNYWPGYQSWSLVFTVNYTITFRML